MIKTSYTGDPVGVLGKVVQLGFFRVVAFRVLYLGLWAAKAVL